MFKIRKSQAALEFLTTYAWVFIIILITIAALAYFGVLSPSKLLPDRCNFGSEVTCDKNRMIIQTSGPTLQLINNFGAAVKMNAVTIINADTGIACTGVTPATATDWLTGAPLTFTGTGCGTLLAGEKSKFTIEIDYYSIAAGPVYTKTVYGEIYSTVK